MFTSEIFRYIFSLVFTLSSKFQFNCMFLVDNIMVLEARPLSPWIIFYDLQFCFGLRAKFKKPRFSHTRTLIMD